MKQVLLIIPRGAEILETIAFIDVFGWDAMLGSWDCELLTASASKTVRFGFGPQITVDMLLEEVNVADFAAVALPGGFAKSGYFRYIDDRVSALLKEFYRAGLPIAAVGTAPLILAKAGILQGRNATVYQEGAPYGKQLAELGVQCKEDLLVIDGNIITAACPGQAMYAALALLSMLTSEKNAAYIKLNIGLD